MGVKTMTTANDLIVTTGNESDPPNQPERGLGSERTFDPTTPSMSGRRETPQNNRYPVGSRFQTQLAMICSVMTIHDKQLQSLRAFCSSFCGRTVVYRIAVCRASVVPG